MPTARIVDSSAARRADLAAIHMGKAALRWSDDEYRDVLYTVCGVRSSAELDFAGRKRFLEHLQACGWKQQRQAPKRVVRTALTPEQRLMWSLWQQLADAGEVKQRNMAGLLAYVKRQTGVDRLEWLKGRQTEVVIESLKQWLARVGAA